MNTTQKIQNTSYKKFINIICQVFVRGILFNLVFAHSMGWKRPKKWPKMSFFDKNRLFSAIKSKFGPKSKIHSIKKFRNVPKLVFSHIWASQDHFCKSSSVFKVFSKSAKIRNFCQKVPGTRPENFLFGIFSQNLTIFS